MRWLFLLLTCFSCFAGTVDVTYTFTDFQLTAQAVKRVTQTPLTPFVDYTNTILSANPNSLVTGGAGSVTFSNTVSGYSYRVQLDTPYGSTIRTSGFPSNVTGPVNGANYLGVWLNQIFYYQNRIQTNVTVGVGQAVTNGDTRLITLNSNLNIDGNITLATDGSAIFADGTMIIEPNGTVLAQNGITVGGGNFYALPGSGFIGNGSGLTNLNATNLVGTVQPGNLPSQNYIPNSSGRGTNTVLLSGGGWLNVTNDNGATGLGVTNLILELVTGTNSYSEINFSKVQGDAAYATIWNNAHHDNAALPGDPSRAEFAIISTRGMSLNWSDIYGNAAMKFGDQTTANNLGWMIVQSSGDTNGHSIPTFWRAQWISNFAGIYNLSPGVMARCTASNRYEFDLYFDLYGTNTDGTWSTNSPMHGIRMVRAEDYRNVILFTNADAVFGSATNSMCRPAGGTHAPFRVLDDQGNVIAQALCDDTGVVRDFQVGVGAATAFDVKNAASQTLFTVSDNRGAAALPQEPANAFVKLDGSQDLKGTFDGGPLTNLTGPNIVGQIIATNKAVMTNDMRALSLSNNATTIYASQVALWDPSNLNPIPLVGGTTQISITNANLVVSSPFTFSGNGSTLTSLNASQLSSGTIPDAQLPTMLANLRGVAGGNTNQIQFTNIDASHIVSGSIALARIPGTVFSGSPPTSPNGWIDFNDAQTGGYGVGNGAAFRVAQGTVGSVSANICSYGSNAVISGALTATNGVSSLLSNLLAPTSITFPASGANWTNPINATIEVYVDNSGVTGTVFKKNGTQIFSSLVGDMTVGLQQGEFFSETYTVGTPSARWSPR